MTDAAHVFGDSCTPLEASAVPKLALDADA